MLFLASCSFETQLLDENEIESMQTKDTLTISEEYSDWTEETHSNEVDNTKQKSASTPITGDIRNREDVVRVLEKVCNFIERTEPTNPAPLLIRRAQYLMTKNFIEIIEELGPDWLKEVQRLSGHGGGKK